MTLAFAPRLLLCRAQGGLNDILSEIGRCMIYARKHNRVVIVETDYFDLNHFNDRFDHYFISSDPSLILDSTDFRDKFDQLSCFPKFVEGRVNSYTSAQETVGIETATKQAVVTDFTRDHEEELLVHHSNGRQKGRNAFVALEKLHLQPHLLSKLEARSKVLGEKYSAIHIRHTDYQTDFKAKVKALKPKISSNVFLATDNRDVLMSCKTLLGNVQIYSFTELPQDAGVPLHHRREISGARQRNEDAILDLFTLVKAESYYFFPRQTNSIAFRPSYSGFSVLADRLRHEPRLLHKVLTGSVNQKLSNGSRISAKLRQMVGR
jgi:hypothetical protein